MNTDMEIDGGSGCYRVNGTSQTSTYDGHGPAAGSLKFLATQARQGWPPHFVASLPANQPDLDAAKRILAVGGRVLWLGCAFLDERWNICARSEERRRAGSGRVETECL